ncbi:hypothetical protein BRADI_4g24465v3 [Brachypodium distachyon]|uniref:Uncharacterized protein n=1 Tax=Brachypodium distachyon TaxID=15368 RepID=A0A0Q3EP06_BRADI|nr:hypothetical protein BRADI_4g24465v3 [Brachypodium distachyon]
MLTSEGAQENCAEMKTGSWLMHAPESILSFETRVYLAMMENRSLLVVFGVISLVYMFS